MERRWEESGLVVLGFVLHAVYMLSIFDIYFKTPIVHGMEPVPPLIHAPAKRLVLFIADGLRADKFYEVDPAGRYRAPFLRSIIQTRGRWGVSHARPPTESRPGHVAIIAGFYEDPSAVTKGWKANPVEFDSLFNRSRHTFAYGSPDIVPMFCGHLSNTHWKAYPHEYEDFVADASFLDEWSFEQVRVLLNQSNGNLHIHKLLHEDQVVIFLHLLGCDTNGHAHRPSSSIYLSNIEVVDAGVKTTVEMIEKLFPDQRTAYVFTADHGMSEKGSHGDGHPTNTETPLVVWGAGVRKPSPASPQDYDDDDPKFVDQHEHHPPTPDHWGLADFERIDVNQGDIAPLMSTLLGLPCPLNSVGTLPLEYLDVSQMEEAEAIFANMKQILNQFLQKSQQKKASSLNFKPYMPLSSYGEDLRKTRELINQQKYEEAIKLAQNLIARSLSGLHYFQTYDWFFLMGTVTMGYLGWMIYISLYVIKNYTSFLHGPIKPIMMSHAAQRKQIVRACGTAIMGVSSIVLLIEHAPWLYHLYLVLALAIWTEIISESNILRNIWNAARTLKISALIKTSFIVGLSLLLLELLVLSFFKREVYTGIFLVAGVLGAVVVSCNIPGLSMIPAFVWASCWWLAGFTLMPVHISDNTLLVVGSGVLVILLAFWSQWLHYFFLPSDQALLLIVGERIRKSRNQSGVFFLQLLFVAISTGMVWVSTFLRAKQRGLSLHIQFINWSLAGVSIILPIFSPPDILLRLTSIFLGFAPTFLLLSIGYEALFYSALGMVLMAWVFIEAITRSGVLSDYYDVSLGSTTFDILVPTPTKGNRLLKLADLRVPLCFMVLINVAFFGTGNVASLASFEISSVYRFITVFSPFTMAALLLWKLLIPFILVMCAFSAVMKLLNLPRLGCFFVVMLLSDVMTIHFFFLVRNTGSWLEIGQSISHFGIMSAQVVFVLLLFAITNVFTRDIVVGSRQQIKST